MPQLSPKAKEILDEVKQDLSLQINIKKTGEAWDAYQDGVNELVSGGYLKVTSETDVEMTLSMV